MSNLRVGLIGWGTVGSALGELVRGGPLPLELGAVAVRDPERTRARPMPSDVRIGSVSEVLEADVVVELAGGIDEPRAWATTVLGAGRAYVTANKALLATHGGELAALATSTGGALLGSASVGGGTPMIETVEHLAATGAVERVRGLVNATTTFILSGMSEGRSYDEALAEAQRAGYAEADPSFDVGGRDAAQKLAILASVAWGAWRPEAEVQTTGIVGVTVAPGQVVRLVAEATQERMTVSPTTIQAADPLASASGVESVLQVTVRDAGSFTIAGPGAGGRVTAGAVYADLARVVAGERPVLFGGAA